MSVYNTGHRIGLQTTLMSLIRWGITRVCEKDKSSGFADGLGEGVVENETIHASCTWSNSIGTERDLVSLTLSMPFLQAEAFLLQFRLRCRLRLISFVVL